MYTELNEKEEGEGTASFCCVCVRQAAAGTGDMNLMIMQTADMSLPGEERRGEGRRGLPEVPERSEFRLKKSPESSSIIHNRLRGDSMCEGRPVSRELP